MDIIVLLILLIVYSLEDPMSAIISSQAMQCKHMIAGTNTKLFEYYTEERSSCWAKLLAAGCIGLTHDTNEKIYHIRK